MQNKVPNRGRRNNNYIWRQNRLNSLINENNFWIHLIIIVVVVAAVVVIVVTATVGGGVVNATIIYSVFTLR
jgi:hypothetical protein